MGVWSQESGQQGAGCLAQGKTKQELSSPVSCSTASPFPYWEDTLKLNFVSLSIRCVENEGRVFGLVNSEGFIMSQGVKIYAPLLRMGDLAKDILDMPQNYLGIHFLKFMLKPEDWCLRNGFDKSMDVV